MRAGDRLVAERPRRLGELAEARGNVGGAC